MQFEMAQGTEGIQALTFWQGVKQTLAEVLWPKGWFCFLCSMREISRWTQPEQDWDLGVTQFE